MADVLIIDDEEPILNLVQRIVQRMGHQAVSASSGSAALALAAERSFALIITDFNLPGEPSGLDLVRALHTCQPASQLVVVTGLADTERVDALREIGICHLLGKPFEMVDLRNLVTSLIPA